MSRVSIQPEGLHAVMAVDPGGTTGVAAAYVELQPTLKATLQTITRRKAVEVSGDWLSQSRELADLMSRFRFTANAESSLPNDHIHFAFEDFVLRRRMAGGATGNLTSVWVAAGAVAIRDDVEVDWQQPSQAKTLASDERLRLWGLWEVGSPHERDAWRHFVLKVNKLVG